MKKTKSKPALREPAEAEVQKLAHRLWVDGGCLEGVELENWHAAKELLCHTAHPAKSVVLPPPDEGGPDNY
jgi:hypothetical protein